MVTFRFESEAVHLLSDDTLTVKFELYHIQRSFGPVLFRNDTGFDQSMNAHMWVSKMTPGLASPLVELSGTRGGQNETVTQHNSHISSVVLPHAPIPHAT